MSTQTCEPIDLSRLDEVTGGVYVSECGKRLSTGMPVEGSGSLPGAVLRCLWTPNQLDEGSRARFPQIR